MEFLKFIYYLGALHFLLSQISWIISPIEKTKKTKELTDLIKENKSKKWDEYPDKLKEKLKHWLLFKLPVVIWLVLGLFTFQWSLVLSFLILQFFIISPISKLFKYSLAYTALHWLNSVVGFFLAIFLVINTYHLKIDFTVIFKNLFGL